MKIPFNFSPLFFIIGLSLIVGINYSIFLPDKTTEDNTSTTTQFIVERGDISTSIEAIGTAQLVDEQQLNFNQAGTVTDVAVKVGDSVKKGDIIAEIDNSSAIADIEDAKIKVENAILSLDSLYDSVDESKLVSAQNSVSNGKINYSLDQKEIQSLTAAQQLTLNQKDLDIQTAKDELILLEESHSNILIEKNNDIANAKKEQVLLVSKQNQEISESLLNISNLEKDIESDKRDLEILKKEFETFSKEIEDSFSSTQTNQNTTIGKTATDFASYKIDIEEIIDDNDEILGVSDDTRQAYLNYKNFFSGKDTLLRQSARTQLTNAIGSYENLKITYENDILEIGTLKEKLNDYKLLFQELYELADTTYKAADASISTIGALSDSEIASMKSGMDSNRNKALNNISSIDSMLNTLSTLTDTDLVSEVNTNSISNKEKNIAAAELSLEKKEANLENLKKNHDQQKSDNELALEKKDFSIKTLQSNLELIIKNQTLDITSKNQNIAKLQDDRGQLYQDYTLTIASKNTALNSSQQNIKVAELSLKELVEGPSTEDIKKAKNAIIQAEISLETITERLDDYKIEAPFDGVISKIDYQVGDKITNDTDKSVYIENPNILEISVSLDQIDIVKVDNDSNAIVTFDAYPTQEVNAKISVIDTTPGQSSGVVLYEVTIVLDDENFDSKVLSGMTADVEIFTLQKNDILLVKTTTISERQGKKFVALQTESGISQIEVETGISDSGMTEILSGVKEGDTLIIKDFAAKSKATTDQPSSLLQAPGGGFNGGGNRQRN